MERPGDWRRADCVPAAGRQRTRAHQHRRAGRRWHGAGGSWVPNGVYYVRVVAGNAAGISAPTADHVIRVGPALPGAPRNLTASASAGGTVAITWLPPSSGGPPSSYLLLAGHTPGATTYQIP